MRRNGGKVTLPTVKLEATVTDANGNKRIGMYVMLTFLEVNGIHVECTNEEVVEAGLSVASGTMDYEALLQWVRDHRI